MSTIDENATFRAFFTGFVIRNNKCKEISQQITLLDSTESIITESNREERRNGEWKNGGSMEGGRRENVREEARERGRKGWREKQNRRGETGRDWQTNRDKERQKIR